MYKKCELTIRVQDKQVTFNVFKAIKFSNVDNGTDFFRIDSTNELITDVLYEIFPIDALEFLLLIM